MTIEESKIMWKIEQENIKPQFSILPKELKKLYIKVDKLISDGIITYEDFTNDTLDAITTNIVDNGKGGTEPSREDQVRVICNSLLKKYEEYTKAESKETDTGVLVDNTEVSE